MIERILSTVALALLAPAALAQAAGCPDRNVQYWQAFPPGGESDLSARHQQLVLKKKCPDIETIIQYKAGAGGALMWTQMNQLPGDGANVVGVNLPHIVFQPIAGRRAVQDRRRDAGVLVPLHAGHPGGERQESDQELPGIHPARQGQPGQHQPGRFGPVLGQPRGPRAPERGLRHQDAVRALQGHGRPRHLGAGRPGRPAR